MAKGDIVSMVPTPVIIEATLKTNTGVTKGDVLAYDTDGLAQAGLTNVGPFFVAYETKAAPGSGLQAKARVVCPGSMVTVATTAAAVKAYKRVMMGGAGVVKEYVPTIKVKTGATAPAVAESGALLIDGAGAEINFRIPKTAASTEYELGLQAGGIASIVGIALTGIGGAGGEIDILLE